jgi:hypothetical protein
VKRAFLEQHWVDDEHRVRINGRMPMNPRRLAVGGRRGTGFLLESVVSCGRAGERQVADAQAASRSPAGSSTPGARCCAG